MIPYFMIGDEVILKKNIVKVGIYSPPWIKNYIDSDSGIIDRITDSLFLVRWNSDGKRFSYTHRQLEHYTTIPFNSEVDDLFDKLLGDL